MNTTKSSKCYLNELICPGQNAFNNVRHVRDSSNVAQFVRAPNSNRKVASLMPHWA